MKGRATKDFINFGLIVGIIIAINVIGQYVYEIWDFTEEKRYTLTDATKKLLDEVDETVYIRILLDGKLQAGFKRLKQSTVELLKDFKSENGLIEYDFEDPTAGSAEKSNARKEELTELGIYPTNLRINSGDETSERLIYPYAMINIGDRYTAVNLLESQGVDVTGELALNNSVSLLEYKFADAIQKLFDIEKPNILITEGNGELEPQQTAALENLLAPSYDVGRINTENINLLDESIDLLIIAGPTEEISQKSQFLIDQYIMKGGHVLWLIDYLNASLDSISKYENFIPNTYPIGIEDMLFNYGARIQPNLILDLESTRIPQVVGVAGGNPQTELVQYYYHPLIAPKSENPIVKNIDRVNMFFPSTIDTIRTKTNVNKEIILSTSEYSRFQIAPMRLNFEMLRYEPDPANFDKGPQPVAVLLEGQFESLFNNRVSERMETMLQDIGQDFKSESAPAKMIIVSDADFTKNLYNPSNNRISPIGYNNWEKFTFKGNQQFIYNCIEYLLDDRGLIEARGKEVKLRMLDKVKIQDERTKWQLINIGLPLVFLLIIGLIYNFLRRRRFSRELS